MPWIIAVVPVLTLAGHFLLGVAAALASLYASPYYSLATPLGDVLPWAFHIALRGGPLPFLYGWPVSLLLGVMGSVGIYLVTRMTRDEEDAGAT